MYKNGPIFIKFLMGILAYKMNKHTKFQANRMIFAKVIHSSARCCPWVGVGHSTLQASKTSHDRRFGRKIWGTRERERERESRGICHMRGPEPESIDWSQEIFAQGRSGAGWA